jgi:hypothetical protein
LRLRYEREAGFLRSDQVGFLSKFSGFCVLVATIAILIRQVIEVVDALLVHGNSICFQAFDGHSSHSDEGLRAPAT